MKSSMFLLFFWLARVSDAFQGSRCLQQVNLVRQKNVPHSCVPIAFARYTTRKGEYLSTVSSSSSSSSSSLVVTRHHPFAATHEEKDSKTSSTVDTVIKNKLSSPQRRNSIIRVSIASLAMFIIASRYTGRSRIGMNAGLSMGLGCFLALMERSRGWMARMRMHATDLWQSVEAHYNAADNMDEGALQEQKSVAAQEWEKTQAAERVTVAGTFVNIGLTVFKLVAGIIGKSSAMVADAGHSLSDLFSDVVTLYTVRIARLPADDDHPYGHGRFEALGALAVAAMLTTAAFGFGTYAYEAFIVMLAGKAAGAQTTGPAGRIALVAAIVSILSKEALYRATAVVAQRTESQVLLANAWHHRSDAFSSIIALISIFGATTGGIPALDPLGGLFVAGMVGITGLRVGWSAFKQLTDTQDFELKAAVERAVKRAVKQYQLQDDVLGLHAVRARYLGSRAWVDLEVETNPFRSTSAATQVVRVLKNEIMSRIPSVNDVAVVLKTQEEVETSDGVNGKGIEGKVELSSKENVVTVTPSKVEASVRRALRKSTAFTPSEARKKHLKSVSSVMVHFGSAQNGQYCDVDIIVSADEGMDMSFSEARELAQIAKNDVIRYADGVVDAKVSLELVEKSEELSLTELKTKKYTNSLANSFARVD